MRSLVLALAICVGACGGEDGWKEPTSDSDLADIPLVNVEEHHIFVSSPQEKACYDSYDSPGEPLCEDTLFGFQFSLQIDSPEPTIAKVEYLDGGSWIPLGLFRSDAHDGALTKAEEVDAWVRGQLIADEGEEIRIRVWTAADAQLAVRRLSGRCRVDGSEGYYQTYNTDPMVEPSQAWKDLCLATMNINMQTEAVSFGSRKQVYSPDHPIPGHVIVDQWVPMGESLVVQLPVETSDEIQFSAVTGGFEIFAPEEWVHWDYVDVHVSADHEQTWHYLHGWRPGKPFLFKGVYRPEVPQEGTYSLRITPKESHDPRGIRIKFWGASTPCDQSLSLDYYVSQHHGLCGYAVTWIGFPLEGGWGVIKRPGDIDWAAKRF